MINTAHADTAAFRLDGSLADSMTIRFADEEVNTSGGDSQVIACGVVCCCVLSTICVVACII